MWSIRMWSFIHLRIRKRLHRRLLHSFTIEHIYQMSNAARSLTPPGRKCSEFLSQFKYCNSNLVNIHFILLNPGMKSAEQDLGPSDQADEQSYFLKEEFHYLNVTQIRKFTMFDMFHCTLACLRNNLCLSLNTASSRGTEGKLWCELLSSDKNRNAENYHKNTSSHHFSILRVRTL